MRIDKDSTGKLSLITNIELVEDREYYPLSPSQKGIFINNIEGDIGYNIPIIKVIEGKLDIERFKVAVETVVKRHEAFRTSFRIMVKIIITENKTTMSDTLWLENSSEKYFIIVKTMHIINMLTPVFITLLKNSRSFSSSNIR